MFPATAQVTPDGEFAFVVNFNLHGDRVPSSVSVVATDGMLEVARIPTCLMPHGSRINAQGTKHYSACMMDDTLVEIDTRTLKVARHFTVTKGSEAGRLGPAGRATRRRPRTPRTAATAPSRRRRAARRARRPGRSRRPTAGASSWRATGRARSSRSTWRRGRWRGACRRDRRLQPRRHARRPAPAGDQPPRAVGVGDRHRARARSWRACRRGAASCTASS